MATKKKAATKKIKTKIKNLLVYEGKIFYDKRGNVREAFKKDVIKKNLFFIFF